MNTNEVLVRIQHAARSAEYAYMKFEINNACYYG